MTDKDNNQIETKVQSVERLANSWERGLYLIEDAVNVAQPFGEEAVEQVREWSATMRQKGAIPHNGASPDDEAVGIYEVAQAAIIAEGEEPLNGGFIGRGFNAERAYKRNMWKLAGMIDGVDRDELGLEDPNS